MFLPLWRSPSPGLCSPARQTFRNVYVIQAGMKLLPLSAYLSEEAYQPPRKGAIRRKTTMFPSTRSSRWIGHILPARQTH